MRKHFPHKQDHLLFQALNLFCEVWKAPKVHDDFAALVHGLLVLGSQQHEFAVFRFGLMRDAVNVIVSPLRQIADFDK
jgi:hypothetical protein